MVDRTHNDAGRSAALGTARVSRRTLLGGTIAGLAAMGGLSGCSLDISGQVDPTQGGISPDGQEFYGIVTEGIVVWNTENGSIIRTMKPTEGWRPKMALSPDGKVIALASQDDTIWLVDSSTGTTVREFEQGHVRNEGESGITSLTWSPDGQMLASAAQDDIIRVWRATGEPVLEFPYATGEASALAFSADNKLLAGVGAVRSARVWSVEKKKLVRVLSDSPPHGHGVAFSPDSRFLATTSFTPGTKDAARTDHVHTFDGPSWSHRAKSSPGAAYGLAFSPDSTTVAYSVPNRNEILLWSEGIKISRTFSGHADNPYYVQFSPDGNLVYSVSAGEGVLKWDAGSGHLRGRFALP